MKKFLPYIIIIGLALLARAIYALYQPNISITPDGLGYYAYGSRLIQAFTLPEFISHFRTPFYPMVIDVAMILAGTNQASVGSPIFNLVMNNLIIIQSLGGIISALIIYLILIKIGIGKRLSLLATIIYATNFLLIPWERALLTESLAVLLVSIFILVFISLLKHPHTIGYVSIWLVAVCLILLRPALILLPFFGFVVLIFYRLKPKLIISGVLLMLSYIAVPLIWTIYNTNVHGYKGFQVYGDLALLGRIILQKIPLDAGKDEIYFYDTLSDYQKHGGEPNPFIYLNTYDPNIFSDSSRMNLLSVFTHKIVLSNIVPYLAGSVGDIPAAIGNISKYIAVAESSPSPAGKIISIGQKFISVVQYFSFISMVVYLPLFWFNRHKITFSESSVLTCAFLYIILLVFNVVVDYEDFGRLNAPIMPLSYISFIWVIHQNITRFSSKKQ